MAAKRQGFAQPIERDTRAHDAAVERFSSPAYMAEIERRWREVWAPKFGLDPSLTGKDRAMAMAKATGLMGALPKATRDALRARALPDREPGQDDEEVAA
jgi:hypothetical protein